MFKVGLTGGIGSGKTVVSDRLGVLGASIVDADRIAHLITAPGGAAIPAIERTFGSTFIAADGSLNRAAMRERVFAQPQERAKLEAITHPLIHEAITAAAEGATGPYVVFVVPLLVESGRWRARVDRILVVDCDEREQIARVVTRSGLSPEQVERIMATQATRAARLSSADDVLRNQDKTLSELFDEIDALHRRYLALAEQGAASDQPVGPPA
ncbi:dephospho-CoA kinase [Chitinasiproducens palmae]|nr:dephospho-CoA kinase [Chitinasiproducens palmae]